MLSVAELAAARADAVKRLESVGMVLTPTEAENIEVADFGLGDLATYGLSIVVYVNTPAVCAKELAMTPWQICPEHRHPPYPRSPGKEETFRCRQGEVRLYVEGAPTPAPACQIPAGDASCFTVWHEVTLRPGEQHTIEPDTRHWFQAGPDGAVVSEFSTTSTDELDVFTDPRIVRDTVVSEDGATGTVGA